jgi:hypothetical protein
MAKMLDRIWSPEILAPAIRKEVDARIAESEELRLAKQTGRRQMARLVITPSGVAYVDVDEEASDGE